MFAKAAARNWGIPFDLKAERFNQETVRAMEDVTAGRSPSPGTFHGTEELVDYLNAWDTPSRQFQA